MENGTDKTQLLHRLLDALALWYKCQRAGKTWGQEDPEQWLRTEAQKFSISFVSMSLAEQDNYLTRLQVMYSTISFLEDESNAKKKLDKLFYGEQMDPDIIFEF